MRERGFFLYDVHKDTFEIYINIYIMNASQYYFIYAMCVCVILECRDFGQKKCTYHMHMIYQYIYIARERVLKHKHVNTHD